MTIQRPTPVEFPELNHLRSAVVNDVYRGLWTTSPIHVEDEDWTHAWVVATSHAIVGVVRTSGPSVDDLWITRDHRGLGLGTRLLMQAELEITRRGYSTALLRVLQANKRAVSFYSSHGWRCQREFPHETLPVLMLELAKELTP